MAANKIVFGNKVLIDLTSDTVSESNLLKGFKAHDKTGMQIIGTYEAEELIGNILEMGLHLEILHTKKRRIQLQPPIIQPVRY